VGITIQEEAMWCFNLLRTSVITSTCKQ